MICFVLWGVLAFGQPFLRGTLVDKNTGSGISQALVKIIGGDESKTDAYGSFKLDLSKGDVVPKPGDAVDLFVQFTTLNPEYKDRYIPVVVPSNYTIKSIDVEKQVIYLIGKLVDATNGEPVTGATVFLTSEAVPLPLESRKKISDNLGYFEFKFFQRQIGDVRVFKLDVYDERGIYKRQADARIILGDLETIKLERNKAEVGNRKGRIRCLTGNLLNMVFTEPNKNSTNEAPVEECTEVFIVRELGAWLNISYQYKGASNSGWIQKEFVELNTIIKP